jgi:hypothetical protein
MKPRRLLEQDSEPDHFIPLSTAIDNVLNSISRHRLNAGEMGGNNRDNVPSSRRLSPPTNACRTSGTDTRTLLLPAPASTIEPEIKTKERCDDQTVANLVEIHGVTSQNVSGHVADQNEKTEHAGDSEQAKPWWVFRTNPA